MNNKRFNEGILFDTTFKIQAKPAITNNMHMVTTLFILLDIELAKYIPMSSTNPNNEKFNQIISLLMEKSEYCKPK